MRPHRDGAEIGAPVLGGVLEPRGGLARCVEQHCSCACCCTAQSQPAKRHARAPLQLMYHMTDFVSQHTGRYRIPNKTDKPACEDKKHVWYMSPHMSSRYLELRDSRGAVRLQTPYGKPTHVYRPIPHRGSSRNSSRVLSPIASSGTARGSSEWILTPLRSKPGRVLKLELAVHQSYTTAAW